MAENRFEPFADPETVTPREAEAAFALWAEGRQEDVEHGRVAISEMAAALGIDEAQARGLVARVRESQRAKERAASYRSVRRGRVRRAVAAAVLAGVLSMGFLAFMRSSRGMPSAYEGATGAEAVAPLPDAQLPPVTAFAPFPTDLGISGLEASLDGYVLEGGRVSRPSPMAEDALVQRLRLLADRTAPPVTNDSVAVDEAQFVACLRNGEPLAGVLTWSDLRLSFTEPGGRMGRDARLKVPRLLAGGNSAVDALYAQELERRLRVAANTGVRLAKGQPVPKP